MPTESRRSGKASRFDFLTASLAAVAAALALFPEPAAAQKEVSLETLARAMEGRLGLYARNLSTDEQIAINADKAFPAGALRATLTADARPAAESRPAAETPRALLELLKARYVSLPRDLSNPLRRALVASSPEPLLGTGVSPAIEIGAAGTGLPKSPGVVGWAASRDGDVLFSVMATDLGSSYTAEGIFPEIITAIVRRLMPAFVEAPLDPKPAGLLLASIHSAKPDPKLFPSAPDPAVADLRRGVQLLSFGGGDVARIAVLARPEAATRVTVQWWSPAERPESRATRVLEGRLIGDTFFDLPLLKLGSWRVRVAYGDTIVLDEKFFVTGK